MGFAIGEVEPPQREIRIAVAGAIEDGAESLAVRADRSP